MEQKMPRYWPGFKVLFIVLLLGLENGALGSINPDNLHKIIKYITAYGNKKFQYAVAVRLDASTCQNPSEDNLKIALPPDEMEKMHEAILATSGIYKPSSEGNVVAARANFNVDPAEHAEWRLLSGDQNSPTANILQNKDDNCLIFFSKWSPCIGQCLKPTSDKYLVKLLNNLFNPLENKAFVFQTVFAKDFVEAEEEAIVNAWKMIKPLFRCDDNECVQCFDNNDVLNAKCLPKKQNVSKSKVKGGKSRKGKERKGKERKGKGRKGKGRRKLLG